MDTTLTFTVDWSWVAVIVLTYFLLTFLYYRPIRDDIAGKYVLITGCDSGFGRLAALRFAREGCHVFAGCLTREGCESVGAESSNIRPILMDVTSPGSVEDALKRVTEVLPPDTGLWGLVNNAGLPGHMGPIDWLSHDDIMHTISVNVVGTIDVARTFLPLLQRCRGRIVNVASILGRVNIPYTGVYCMTKHAVESLSDTLRVEVSPFGVGVSVIEPGAHSTAFLSSMETSILAAWKQLPPARQQVYGMDYLDRVLYMGTRFVRLFASSAVDNVVSAYHHALFSVRPRRRYLVGIDAHLMRIITWLPDAITDRLYTMPGVGAVPAVCRRPS